MKNILYIFISLICFIGYSQEYIPINTGYGFEPTTTTQLNALTKKAEGDIFYDTTTDAHVYWDGSIFNEFGTGGSGTNFIKVTPSEYLALSPTDLANNDYLIVDVNTSVAGALTQEDIEDIIGLRVVGGTNVTVSYNDTTGETTINSTASGGVGDMLESVYDTNANDIVDNSEALGGISSSQFLRSDASDIKTSGALKFNDNVELQFGTGTFARMFGNGSNTLLNLGNGNFIIQDGGVNKITFNRTDGNIITGGYVSVGDEAYGAGWNGSTEVPTKNAVYDQIQTLGSATSGTWTPVLEAGADTPYTYTAQGYYIKIGDLVHLWAYFTDINGSAASGNLEVTGLPFNANVASFSSEQQMFPYFITGTSSAAITNPIGEVSSNTLRLRNQDGVTNSANAGVDFSGSGRIIINMTYISQ